MMRVNYYFFLSFFFSSFVYAEKRRKKEKWKERESAGIVIMYNKEENQGHDRLMLSWLFLVQKSGYYVH